MDPQASFVGFLLPIGLWLALSASAEPEREARAAVAGLIAIATGTLLFAIAGFGLMFGGVGALTGRAEYAALNAFFAVSSPGGSWPIVGLSGFGVASLGESQALLLSFLPVVQTASVLVAVALWRHAGFGRLALAAALATFALSCIGMAVWGGGAGAALANRLRLGHGPVDGAALGVAGLTAGVIAFLAAPGGGIPPRQLKESPRPLLAMTGALLAVAGACGVAVANPFGPGIRAAGDFALALIVSACVAALVSAIYAHFVSGRPSLDTVGSSVVAGLLAASAGAPNLPLGAAVLAGIAAAGWVMLGDALLAGRLGAFRSSALTRVAMPAAFGLVLAGLVSTGVYGAGLNGIGAKTHLGVEGLGVTALFGAAASDPGQLTAQIVTLVTAIGVAALFGIPLRAIPQPALGTPDAHEAEPALDVQPPQPEPDVEPGFTGVDEQDAGIPDTGPWEAPVGASPVAPTPVFDEAPAPVFAAAPTAIATETTAAPANPLPVDVPEPLAAPAPVIESVPLPVYTAAPNVSATAPTPEPVASPTAGIPDPPPAPAPATREEARTESLLERLRRNRAQPPKPVGQARRVAYPVRVGGRRLVLRAIPPDPPPKDVP